MRAKFFQHRKEHNGGHSYEAFNLSDDMTHHSGQHNKDGEIFTMMESSKNAKDTQLTGLRWKKFTGLPLNEGVTKCNPMDIIFLPEFSNLHLFVSSFALLMNEFIAEKKLQRHHAMQLLCVASLTPSQMQFQFVVWNLMKHCKPKKIVFGMHEPLQRQRPLCQWWNKTKVHGGTRQRAAKEFG